MSRWIQKPHPPFTGPCDKNALQVSGLDKPNKIKWKKKNIEFQYPARIGALVQHFGVIKFNVEVNQESQSETKEEKNMAGKVCEFGIMM